jgi:AmmeMemoRadiSam system protein A
MDFNLSRYSKLVLLRTARNAITAKLKQTERDKIEISEELNFNGGCFVTINLRKRLRGCIGNFREDINIIENVSEMAVQAAFSDPRFAPVSNDEFPQCELEISVLSPMIPAKSEEIKTGRDGIYIIKGLNRGVLLPQVATENDWDTETFLQQTCIKAGLSPDSWMDKDTKIYRFEALVFSEDNLYNSEDK